MAKDLLDDADMHALLDQESRGSVAGIVDPGVPDLRLPKDDLPRAPVLSPFDRAAAPGGENQVMIHPRAARPQPLRGLLLAVLPQQLQERGRTLEGELALPLALPENDAATNTVWAFSSVTSAV
jgi:hypothetical protein